MGVRGVLEWAFGAEHARLDFDEIEESAGGGRSGIGLEYVLIQRAMIGQVDTSPGRSSPADDAEIIASVLRAALPWRDALWLADLARAGRSPDPMLGVRPGLVPERWHENRHGTRPATADAAELGTCGWRAQPRRNRKGALVHDPVRYTPCLWRPAPADIAAARRLWLDWWGHLLTVQVALRAVDLRWIEVTTAMPPLEPWRECS